MGGEFYLVSMIKTCKVHLESAAFDIDKNASFFDEQNGVQIQLIKKIGKSYDIFVERR